MIPPLSPLATLTRALADGSATPLTVAEMTLARANRSASANTYQWLDWEWLLDQAHALESLGRAGKRHPLWAVPISVKDCFDLAGTVTTCGTRFYANCPPATQDSALVSRLRATGALITGKTHLHPLAYGITGQNPDYGDCLQPRDPSVLTGGSSSGAAASVQEGSALAAIGTDTGGSIRVPAALCGLTGFRASHARAHQPETSLWQGAMHLAPSFDTVGLLVRDPRDIAPIARALFSIPRADAADAAALRIGWAGGHLLADCDPEVRQAFVAWQAALSASGADIVEITPDWDGAPEIFAGLQAQEAAALHAGHFDEFEAAIRDRLHWGASLSAETIDDLRHRQQAFQSQMDELFHDCDLLLLPAAPISRLAAGTDLSAARARILRYTTPFSLCGLPALSLPGELLGASLGTGIQIAAPAGSDARLLAFADAVGASLARADAPGSSHAPA